MIPDWRAVRDLNTRPSACKPAQSNIAQQRSIDKRLSRLQFGKKYERSCSPLRVGELLQNWLHLGLAAGQLSSEVVRREVIVYGKVAAKLRARSRRGQEGWRVDLI